MTSPMMAGIRDRLTRLTNTLRDLKERVREAVATELGRVVADAVRDLLTLVLRSRPALDAEDEPRSFRTRPDDRWGERRPGQDPWDEEESDPWEESRADSVERWREPDPPPSASPALANWAPALSVGVVLARWLWTRQLRLGAGLGLGVALGTVILVGGPVVRTLLVSLATAADLISLTQLSPD